ncbi:SanA/YdcF family protein [Sediminicola luteus]|uniref:Protein SanA n=1 Tax=Sediminicola luteus TaxID=319238 RepID=A0A2A4G925_9FLAO|nr:ElyC/SanA/YdcF family protein [Sediminicola luteus]PCE64255.1 protein SanA [Sediminicola luteus]
MHNWTKKTLKVLLFGGVLLLLIILLCDRQVSSSASGLLHNRIAETPKNKVGLLLGTSKYLVQGGINPYFEYRVEAAVALFNAQKIEFILVSGDNGNKNYNEPQAFKEELVKRGIPEDKIILDYAGFSTLDSVIRAHKIFGQDSFTVISQAFHNERAIYLAQGHAIQAIGFNAQDVPAQYALKVTLREYLARTKAFLDLQFGRGPKFLGDPIAIP